MKHTKEDELFQELLQSVREAGAIVRSEAQLARVTKLKKSVPPPTFPIEPAPPRRSQTL